MEPKKPATQPRETGREDRLKAALKANMARRKAQARARGTARTGETAGGNPAKAEGRLRYGFDCRHRAAAR